MDPQTARPPSDPPAPKPIVMISSWPPRLCGIATFAEEAMEFIRAHANGNGNGGKAGGGKAKADISIYGQESNYTTWRLAKMNLAIRGIDGQIAHGDTFHNDRHPDLKADFILANPPFNVSDWGGDRLREDKRWQHGVPPAGNANFAWVQHIIHHLAPTGHAGFVLANGSMSSNQSGEGDIRRSIVEADLVDCMVALPGQLFYSTSIPVCLWFLARDKRDHDCRDRRGEVLFIDARQMGTMVDRTHRELTGDDIAKIADTYHAWRSRPADATTDAPTAGAIPPGGQPQGVAPTAPCAPVPAMTSNAAASGGAGPGGVPTPACPPTGPAPTTTTEYQDVPGFCKSATLDDIRRHHHILTPGRYVGAAEVEDDGRRPEHRHDLDDAGGQVRLGRLRHAHLLALADPDGQDRQRADHEPDEPGEHGGP